MGDLTQLDAPSDGAVGGMGDGIPEPNPIDLVGRRIALARAGTGSPAVVLVGGNGLDMRLWRGVFPTVAAD